MDTIKKLVFNNDRQLYLLLNSRSKSLWFASTMRFVTHMGDTTTAIFFTSFALLLDQLLQIPIGKTMLLTLIISQILVQTIKRIVNRPRPYKSIDLANVTNPPACQYSFPSGCIKPYPVLKQIALNIHD